MGTLRTRLLPIGGIVLGVIAFRAWRQRRNTTEVEEINHSDVETASDHIVAATEHAKLATMKAINRKRED